MDATERAVGVLLEAEEKLAAVLRDSVEARAYEAVASVAAISNRLAGLIEEVQQRDPLPPSHSGDLSQRPRSEPSPNNNPGNRASSKVSRGRPGAYPRFARDGDRLVKIGWSKKEGKEYEHRASRTAVQGVVSALRANEDREFSMDDLLPMTDHEGEEIPSYQAYLVLAWLRSWGAVQKASRGGYVCQSERLEQGELDAAWEDIASPDAEEDSE